MIHVLVPAGGAIMLVVNMPSRRTSFPKSRECKDCLLGTCRPAGVRGDGTKQALQHVVHLLISCIFLSSMRSPHAYKHVLSYRASWAACCLLLSQLGCMHAWASAKECRRHPGWPLGIPGFRCQWRHDSQETRVSLVYVLLGPVQRLPCGQSHC